MSLAAALDEWRHTRAPEIADAIDALDAAARAGLSLPRARTKVEFQAAWLAIADADDPAATGWLVDTWTEKLHLASDYFGILDPNYAARKFATFLERVARLAQRMPDPRIARAAVGLLRAPPFTVADAHAARLVYGPLLELVVESRDVRAIAPLAELLRSPRAPNVTLRQFLSDELPALLERLRAVEPRLDEAARARWQAIGGGDRQRDESTARSALDGAQLLAQIRAQPDDDGLRLVYADWLQERGDPLGELIVLQDRIARSAATEKEQKRARALVRAHKDEWLGPLALVLRGVEFERGFLARAELAQTAAAAAETWQACAADERLATLRELRQGRGSLEHYRQLILSPAARGLTTIEIGMPSVMEKLLEANLPPRLRQLEFRRLPRRPLLLRMAAHASLANVRVLRVLVETDDVAPLLDLLRDAGWLDRLAELQLSPTLSRYYVHSDPSLEPMGRAVSRALEQQSAKVPPSLARIAIVGHRGELLAEWRGPGRDAG